MLVQREHCARCAGPLRHGDISTVTVTRLVEIGIYILNTGIYHEKNAVCVWRTFFWGGFTVASCTRPSQSEFGISRRTRLVSRTIEVRVWFATNVAPGRKKCGGVQGEHESGGSHLPAAELHLTTNDRTLRAAFWNEGYNRRIARKKPFLSAKVKAERLRLCLERQNWTAEGGFHG